MTTYDKAKMALWSLSWDIPIIWDKFKHGEGLQSPGYKKFDRVMTRAHIELVEFFYPGGSQGA